MDALQCVFMLTILAFAAVFAASHPKNWDNEYSLLDMNYIASLFSRTQLYCLGLVVARFLYLAIHSLFVIRLHRLSPDNDTLVHADEIIAEAPMPVSSPIEPDHVTNATPFEAKLTQSILETHEDEERQQSMWDSHGYIDQIVEKDKEIARLREQNLALEAQHQARLSAGKDRMTVSSMIRGLAAWLSVIGSNVSCFLSASSLVLTFFLSALVSVTSRVSVRVVLVGRSFARSVTQTFSNMSLSVASIARSAVRAVIAQVFAWYSDARSVVLSLFLTLTLLPARLAAYAAILADKVAHGGLVVFIACWLAVDTILGHVATAIAKHQLYLQYENHEVEIEKLRGDYKSQLEHMSRQLSEEKAQLNKTVSGLQKEKGELEASLGFVDKQKQAAEARMKAQEQAAERQKQLLEAHKQEAESRLTTQERSMATLIWRKQKKIRRLNARAVKLARHARSKEDLLKRRQEEDRTAAESRTKALEAQVQENDAKLKNAVAGKVAAEQSKQTVEAKAQELEKKVHSVETKLKKVADAKAAAEKDGQTLQTKAQGLEKQVNEAKAQITKMTEAKDAAEKELQAFQAKMQELEQQAKTKTADADVKLVAQLNESAKREKKLESRVGELFGEISQLKEDMVSKSELKKALDDKQEAEKSKEVFVDTSKKFLVKALNKQVDQGARTKAMKDLWSFLAGSGGSSKTAPPATESVQPAAAAVASAATSSPDTELSTTSPQAEAKTEAKTVASEPAPRASSKVSGDAKSETKAASSEPVPQVAAFQPTPQVAAAQPTPQASSKTSGVTKPETEVAAPEPAPQVAADQPTPQASSKTSGDAKPKGMAKKTGTSSMSVVKKPVRKSKNPAQTQQATSTAALDDAPAASPDVASVGKAVTSTESKAAAQPVSSSGTPEVASSTPQKDDLPTASANTLGDHGQLLPTQPAAPVNQVAPEQTSVLSAASTTTDSAANKEESSLTAPQAAQVLNGEAAPVTKGSSAAVENTVEYCTLQGDAAAHATAEEWLRNNCLYLSDSRHNPANKRKPTPPTPVTEEWLQQNGQDLITIRKNPANKKRESPRRKILSYSPHHECSKSPKSGRRWSGSSQGSERSGSPRRPKSPLMVEEQTVSSAQQSAQFTGATMAQAPTGPYNPFGAGIANAAAPAQADEMEDVTPFDPNDLVAPIKEAQSSHSGEPEEMQCAEDVGSQDLQPAKPKFNNVPAITPPGDDIMGDATDSQLAGDLMQSLIPGPSFGFNQPQVPTHNFLTQPSFGFQQQEAPIWAPQQDDAMAVVDPTNDARNQPPDKPAQAPSWSNAFNQPAGLAQGPAWPNNTAPVHSQPAATPAPNPILFPGMNAGPAAPAPVTNNFFTIMNLPSSKPKWGPLASQAAAAGGASGGHPLKQVMNVGSQISSKGTLPQPSTQAGKSLAALTYLGSGGDSTGSLSQASSWTAAKKPSVRQQMKNIETAKKHVMTEEDDTDPDL